MMTRIANERLDAEWIEADGLGGFASGTVGGERTRRYHALLLAATTPPTGRQVLVNGLDAWIETAAARYALTTQRYAPDVVHTDGHPRLVDFRAEPWPQWHHRAADGTEVVHELLACRGKPQVVLRWRRASGRGPARLIVRPLFSGRDYHALHRENAAFRFAPETVGARLTWRPYDGTLPVTAISNGTYCQDATWYRNFVYRSERERGLDFVEDLAAPGMFTWDLGEGPALLVLAAGQVETDGLADAAAAAAFANRLLTAEAKRRKAFATPLHRAAEAFVVHRGAGQTVIAGYPWFTDWGRDTFIALRGLMTIPGGLATARDVLVAWSATVSQGMLPNRFPDGGEQPEFNAVDASLWYVVAVHDFLQEAERSSFALTAGVKEKLYEAVDAILEGYHAGTRYGIRMDADGLIAAGMPGVQLTWMDAKIGDWVVTPRTGKPVEVQALWLNALRIAAPRSRRWSELHERAAAAFRAGFWNAERGCLYDVIDVDHVAGRRDASIRPNQIFAVGGLPFQALDEPCASRVVETVERDLLTPIGLRSLAPGEPGYRGRYEGGVLERDSAYHQGTVWPWLLGPFVEAWLRVQGSSAETRQDARRRFLDPLFRHIDDAGLGHVSEIADGDAPHQPRGCPFQAWSLGELLRVQRLVAETDAVAPRRTVARRRRTVPAECRRIQS